jgi:hypothetical protein
MEWLNADTMRDERRTVDARVRAIRSGRPKRSRRCSIDRTPRWRDGMR